MAQLQSTDLHPAPAGPSGESPAPRRSVMHKQQGWLALAVLLVLLLLTFLPPLLSISRYQRRVAASMSRVLGRPVHLEHVALNLLPFPSLTLSNLVIDELPPFGEEPIVRAASVNARLRLAPLWRHRVEFSRITFTDPSVNLVRLPDGRWNLESVLLQAAHIDAAPTTQRRAGEQPRFPYIEADGARVNLKLGEEKTPFSLLETDFALWLPEPQSWRVRLRGRPARTDTSATDTGTVRVEAALRRANSIENVPLTLDASWEGAPLGQASSIVMGRDAGLRGGLRATIAMRGTLGNTALRSEFALSDLHRVDNVADRSVDLDLKCSAAGRRLLHSMEAIQCAWTPDGTGEVRLTGSLHDVQRPRDAQLQLAAETISGTTATRWLRAATRGLAPGVRASGQLSLRAAYSPGNGVTAQLGSTDLRLAGGPLTDQPVAVGPLNLSAQLPQWGSPARPAGQELSLAPVTLALDPAANSLMTLSLGADQHGLSLRLAGTAPPSRVAALLHSVPALSEGLDDAMPQAQEDVPVALDLVAHRPWGGPQQWSDLGGAPRAGTPSSGARHHR